MQPRATRTSWRHCSIARACTRRRARSSNRSNRSLGPTPRPPFSKALVALLVAAAAPVAIAHGATKPPVKVTHLSDDFFNRGKITIKKGTVVNWKWSTEHRHTVTEYNGRWGTTSETRTGNFKHRFKKKGTWTVYCLVHPVEMRQKIVVK